LDLPAEKGIIAGRTIPVDVTPVQRLLDEYALYLLQERALAPPTRVNYLRLSRSFLTERFGTGRPRLAVLCAADVVRYVQRQAAHRSPKVAKLVTSALRSFLRYARYRDYITIDLAAAVPAVANWSMATIPRSITPNHVRRVLAHCNRQSAVGRRDYAILLLLARLGLRAGEIAGLALEDIDWEVGCLNVRGKGGHRSPLPLLAEVGEAIAMYLRDGRPASTSRLVFLRARVASSSGPGASGRTASNIGAILPPHRYWPPRRTGSSPRLLPRTVDSRINQHRMNPQPPPARFILIPRSCPIPTSNSRLNQ